MKFFAARSTTKSGGKKSASGRGKGKAAPAPAPSLNPDRVLDALGILLAVAGIVILLSFLSQSQSPLMNALIGPLSTLLGWGAFLAPLAMVAIGLYLIARHFGDFPRPPVGRILGGLMAYVTLLALLHAMFAMGGTLPMTQAPANAWGGTLGHGIFRALTVFGSVGALIVLLAALIIACTALFGMTVAQLITGVRHLWEATVARFTGRAPYYADDDGPRINRNMRGASRETITPPWDPGRNPGGARDEDDGDIRINGLKPAPKPAKAAKREWVKQPPPAEDDDEAGVQLPLPKAPKPAPAPGAARKPAMDDMRINVGQRAQPPAEFTPSNERKAQSPHVIGGTGALAAAAASSIQMQQEPAREWVLPQVPEVLEPGREATKSEDDIRQRARMIEDTLMSFGVPAKVTEVNPGPTITQFCVEPGFSELKSGKQQKVKVSRIAALADDLALALAAPRIRIEAPVPGKSYVGIEVPNGETALVSLRDVMESEEYDRLERKTRLRLGLGSDVSGRPVVADLTAMPHLLIAGTTGSGKSVCVNSIITALLINNSPEDCRLLMVDPKRVELTGYNGIPHLIAPVVVDVEQVGGVLKWTTNEMDRRYRMFAKHGARNITDWNTKVEERKQNTESRTQNGPASPQPPATSDPDFRKLPYIVLFIDELADLMMLAPDETEKTICRLAQMARATGIHLIIATQRPSVDVVTGLIKANFPARVAFTVASAIDSRVILDGPGAEKLLGRGDMLVLTPDVPAPQRAQGCFLSDKEIQKVVRHWRAQSAGATAAPIVATQQRLPIAERPMDGAGLPTASNMPASAPTTPPWETAPDFAAIVKADTAEANSGSGTGDSLFDEAVATVRLQGKASISLLQRRLRIGYTRAARMIEEMEEKGIVGPNTPGSQFRDVLPPKV